MVTVIGVLASSGLRSGEVVRLDRSDVDLSNGILLVRKTKFRKDRLVPVHTTTQTALRHYVRERDAAFPTPKDQAFFLSSRGNRLSASGLQSAFAQVRKLAGLDDGKPLRPHDLRHRFAVTRLSLWHEQRANVQALLPLLDELEEKRNNSIATRNARLAAIRSFVHHVAAADPASFGVAQRVLTSPGPNAAASIRH